MKNIKTEIMFLIVTVFAGLVGFAANTGSAKGHGSDISAYPTPPPPPTPYPPISYPAPSVVWSTFEGSSGADYGSDIDADYNGNIYVTGTSNNANWDGSPINPWAGADDAFVAKLNQEGVLQWYTFLGGTGSDSGTSIFVDNDGNIFITGKSDSSWGSNPIRGFQSNNDAFVAKLNSNGDLQWHTFIGGTADDQGEDVLYAGNGILYLTGTSSASWGGGADPDPTRAYTNGIGSDAFVAKLSSTGVLQWHAFLGGADYDTAAKISTTYGEYVYAIGQSLATWGQPVRAFGGTSDVYVTKLDSVGALQWNTFLGGTNSEDTGHGVSVGWDVVGFYGYEKLYIAGESSESWGSPVNPFSGVSAHDGFVAKLNSIGQIEWNTFLGGNAYDSVSDVQYKNRFSVLVTGASQESWGTPFIPFHGSGSTQDGFVASLDPSGNYQWNAFLGAAGGLDGDFATSITTWRKRFFVTGHSTAPWGTSPVHAYSGDADAFVARLGEIPVPPVVVSIVRANPNPTNVATVDFTVTFTKPVYGVDATDLILTTSSVSSATISGIIDYEDVYTVTVNTGSGDGTIRLDLADDNSIWDYTENSLGGVAVGDGDFTAGEVYTINKSSTFADVPLAYWSNTFIERLYNANITGGCSAIPLNYCPTNQVTRAQMAIFLVRAIHGVSFVPPTATGVFTDVPVGSFGANFIEQLAADGITSGCGGGKYCPGASVTRAQMAIFLVRAMHGVAFVPPTATGVFSDVPVGSFGADFIEQLAADAITSGCGAGIYCPATTVKRDSMAVFLVRAFNLP